MSDDIAIQVRGLGKKYEIGGPQEKYNTFRDAIVNSVKSPFRRMAAKDSDQSTTEFWALKDVSFDVHKGEVIGIIGRNGAGKSTLLKILSRITLPSEGIVEIHGRIGSLLEVGTGFHPELTGRENIFLSGSILGMKKREIEEKFDDIVKFSEIEKFIDTPVKRYSSGMYVRLAFAVAAHLEPEILIVDEVLAVGDAEFQKKCLGKMGDISKEGRTVLFVSHNMGAIATLCNRGILLQNGGIVCNTKIRECISSYLSITRNLNATKNLAHVQRISKYTGEARIIGFSIHNVDSNDDAISAEKPCKAELVFEVFEDNVTVGGEFTISDGIQKLCLFHSGHRNGLNPVLNKGIHKLICNTGALPLYSGEYYISLALSRPGIPIDYIENAVTINVVMSHRDGSMYDYKKQTGSSNFYIEHTWVLEK